MISFMGHYWRAFVHLQNTPENDNKSNLAYQLMSVEIILWFLARKTMFLNNQFKQNRLTK